MVLAEKLLKNDLHDGMHREAMLGFSYRLGFFLHDDQVPSFYLQARKECLSSITHHHFHIGIISPVLPKPYQQKAVVCASPESNDEGRL